MSRGLHERIDHQSCSTCNKALQLQGCYHCDLEASSQFQLLECAILQRRATKQTFDKAAVSCDMCDTVLQVKACCSFVEKTGKPAGIGELQDAVEIVLGQKGTLIVPAAAQTSS